MKPLPPPTPPELDYLDRLVDALFACDCNKCQRERTEQLMCALQLHFGCGPVAEYAAKQKLAIN